MKIWKDNEIQRYKDNVTYAYSKYLSSNSPEDWVQFWGALKIFLKESEYCNIEDFQSNANSYYIPYAENKSIFSPLE